MSEPNRFVPDEILVFTPYIGAFGGVERLIVALCRHFHQRGRAHRVICFDDTIGLDSHANWPLHVQKLRPRRAPWSEARALRNILRAAHREGAAIPLLFDLKSAFFTGLALPGPFFLHLTDPPSLLPSEVSKKAPSARRSYPSFAQEPPAALLRAIHAEGVHRLNRRGARSATKVIAMTHTIASELDQLYGVKAHIVRPGVYVGQANLGRTLESGQLNLLSVSRLEANKRIDWMLRALGKLENAFPPLRRRSNWQLHVVGSGSQEVALKNLAVALGIEARVIFHGRVDDDELEDIYSRADLFLMPAVQGYGLPALEALTRGVAVILHCESGVAEILSNSPWVEIIEQDENDLMIAIEKMIDRFQSGVLQQQPLPHVPTESEWADNICQVCGWF